MKREGTIGAATFLALAAVVGFSLQSGPKQEVGGKSEVASAMKRTKPAVGKATAHVRRNQQPTTSLKRLYREGIRD